MAGKSFHLVSQIYKIQTEDIHIKVFRPNEGLTLETSAVETLYGGQFTLSTQLIQPNYLVLLETQLKPLIYTAISRTKNSSAVSRY